MTAVHEDRGRAAVRRSAGRHRPRHRDTLDRAARGDNRFGALQRIRSRLQWRRRAGGAAGAQHGSSSYNGEANGALAAPSTDLVDRPRRPRPRPQRAAVRAAERERSVEPPAASVKEFRQSAPRAGLARFRWRARAQRPSGAGMGATVDLPYYLCARCWSALAGTSFGLAGRLHQSRPDVRQGHACCDRRGGADQPVAADLDRPTGNTETPAANPDPARPSSRPTSRLPTGRRPQPATAQSPWPTAGSAIAGR